MSDTEIYQNLYDNTTISAWSTSTVRPDWNLIVDHIYKHLPQGGQILDYGCYTGGLLTLLESKYTRYGVEINKTAAAIAAAKGHVQTWSSTNDIPCDLRFDAIIASDVIEHMPNPGKMIERLLPLLAENGILIITTGDADNYLWNRFGANWWYCFYPEHISFISKKWLYNFSQNNKYSIERCETFFYSHPSAINRHLNVFLAYFYGLFPRTYLRLARMLAKFWGRPDITSIPGNGISADHLFIVLAGKRGI